MKRWTVVLRLASKTITEKADVGRIIVKAMEDNPYFPDPVPNLKTVTNLVNELQAAYDASRDASKEQTAKMYTIEFDLVTQLNALGNYVEGIANNDNKIGDTIIYSAGMEVKQKSTRPERKLTVKNTARSGFVVLTSRSEDRASYVWQYSLDQENWVYTDVTTHSNTTIENLKPGKRYYFRVAIVSNNIQGAWEGPINIIVT
jgi:hypothetical protein